MRAANALAAVWFSVGQAARQSSVTVALSAPNSLLRDVSGASCAVSSPASTPAVRTGSVPWTARCTASQARIALG